MGKFMQTPCKSSRVPWATRTSSLIVHEYPSLDATKLASLPRTEAPQAKKEDFRRVAYGKKARACINQISTPQTTQSNMSYHFSVVRRVGEPFSANLARISPNMREKTFCFGRGPGGQRKKKRFALRESRFVSLMQPPGGRETRLGTGGSAGN